MKNLSLISKIFLTIVFISGTLWLGSYTVKLFSLYGFFEVDESSNLFLKNDIFQNDIFPALYELLPALVISLLSYIVFIISVILFIVFSRINLKKNGWLFISLMIIIFCFPFEIILSLKDYKIISLLLEKSLNTNEIVELMKLRISQFSSFPIVSLILHYSIISLIVFRPLSKES